MFCQVRNELFVANNSTSTEVHVLSIPLASDLVKTNQHLRTISFSSRPVSIAWCAFKPELLYIFDSNSSAIQVYDLKTITSTPSSSSSGSSASASATTTTDIIAREYLTSPMQTFQGNFSSDYPFISVNGNKLFVTVVNRNLVGIFNLDTHLFERNLEGFYYSRQTCPFRNSLIVADRYNNRIVVHTDSSWV